MFSIDWHQIEKNAEGSPQVFFEKFIYQISVKRYQTLGFVRYFYNAPGSEFYLTLNKDADIEGAQLKQGDVVGWQAKFWFNRRDADNSPLDANNRAELIKGFKKSLEYEPNLMIWIICTPGLFSITKTKSGIKPFEELESELKAIKPDVRIFHWHKDYLESFAHEEPDRYGSIFNHYCASNFLSYSVFKDRSEKKLDILRKRYDTDLYTSGKADRDILSSILYKDLLDELHNKIKHSLEDRIQFIESYLYRKVIGKFVNSTGTPEVSDDNKKRISILLELVDSFLDLHHKLHIYNEQENSLELIESLYELMEADRHDINDLINDSGLNERHSYDIDIDYDLDIDDTHHLLNYLYAIAWDWLEKTKKIYRLTVHLSRQVFHVFGEAGDVVPEVVEVKKRLD